MKIYGKQIKREHLIHVRLGALKTNMKFPNSQQSSDTAINFIKYPLKYKRDSPLTVNMS